VPEIPAVSGELGGAGLRSRAGLRVSRPAGSLADRVSEVFGSEGPLARGLPDFETRAGQLEVASAVARTFDEGGVLLAEAGTGTGKTLAYLVPAILSGERVLISTGTKTLQEQIYFKDIPSLRSALGIPFTATYMKGRTNYLCLHRLDPLAGTDRGTPRQVPSDDRRTASRRRRKTPKRSREAGAPLTVADEALLSIITEWSTRTETGDRAELEDLPEDLPFWNEVSAAAERCLGSDCPRYDDCFVTRMRQRAAECDLVIVNHHLLCADAAVRQNAYGEVIPACSHAVLDEAHQLEDVATQYFGVSVSNHRIENIARDVERLLETGGATGDSRVRDRLGGALERLRDEARAFFDELALAHRAEMRGRGEERVSATQASLSETLESAARLSGALEILESTLARLGGGAEEPPRGVDAAALARRAGELRDEMRLLLRADNPEYVYFVEFRGRGVFLRASPIDVSAIVRELLLDRMRTTVLTSATLTVDGTFGYLRGRLGIREAVEVSRTSEFDFVRQAMLYLPPHMPDPRSSDFPMAAGREVVEILRRTRGRAFVLFTSYATLHEVRAFAEMALEYPILVQGSAPRTQLLKRFRETPNAVLLATSSFWQGVDVIGEALSCVIIDKLPFASPAEPITAARIGAIRSRGGEPFHEYQVPLAILALRQGLGRLIRHRRDRGVLAVLDPRLRTKSYGPRFLASLPPAPVVHDLALVERFLQ
jgi:ATP-dependent DNA helicase DinG